MDRREFLQVTAATALVAQGYLPLLAAEPSRKRVLRKREAAGHGGPGNTFTEPPAIEPVTGYLPGFKPVTRGSMTGAFTAIYTLIACHGSAAQSKNNVSGSVEVAFAGALCKTTEVRRAARPNTVKTEIECEGEWNAAVKWTLDSSFSGAGDLRFVEKGVWDGKAMVVKAKSWTQRRATSNSLIGRWALLPLLSSGAFKSKPLTFDLLDDSALRPDQTLRYTGEVEIPVAGGNARLDCYAQTGRGMVPTHYLVDGGGLVQLITMSTVNWALACLR